MMGIPLDCKERGEISHVKFDAYFQGAQPSTCLQRKAPPNRAKLLARLPWVDDGGKKTCAMMSLKYPKSVKSNHSKAFPDTPAMDCSNSFPMIPRGNDLHVTLLSMIPSVFVSALVISILSPHIFCVSI